MTNPRILNSRDIGITENALRAVLTKTLTSSNLDYNRWVALKVLAESTSPTLATDLAKQLKGVLKIDDATVVEVLDDLKERGIFGEAGDVVSPTADGASLYRRLNDQIRQVSEQMYSGLDVNELATAYRVLSTLAERANAILAS